MNDKNSEDKGRRSGAERRLKYISPYMKFVYNGDEKRSKKERREDQERRDKPRDEQTEE